MKHAAEQADAQEETEGSHALILGGHWFDQASVGQ
jgi:hypothetical protein